ncbi:unnamed protein product [Porites evermanni]|uniref:Death domain-containing protein n=1 Tax=Porites evermanni TaxID=104178 RepID=A0ABN8LTZ7_9CNID|nr:unnamed protein product [Porites evermanni]
MDRTVSFKSGVPSSSDLLLIASGLGSSWKMLGRILCLPEPVLEQMEEDERHLHEKSYAVLKKWIQTAGPAASYKCLAQALQHPIVRRSELATKYCHERIDTG